MARASQPTDLFHQTFQDFYSPLCYFAESIVKETAAAQDIVTDVFIKLWEKEPELSGYKNLKAVLYISVKNACYNLLRANSRMRNRANHFAFYTENDVERNVLNSMIRSEVLREATKEIQNLPPQCRKVMELYFADGYDSDKISSKLDLSINTIRWQKARGIKLLRKKMAYLLLVLPWISFLVSLE